jgi:anti-sigma factor ChrR (cupin superfamily)
MNAHEFLDDDLRDLASLFVLGSVEPEAARGFRLHLAACDVCRAEVESLARTTARLTLAAPEIAPDPRLWTRVLERIRARAPRGAAASRRPTQVWKSWTAAEETDAPPDDGLLRADASEADFEPTGIEGIEVRRLAVDRAKDQVTMLVRMAPGTAYPAHRHGGAEECFVVEGDLRVGDLHMRRGDFQRSESGTLHPIQSTDGGCVLLIVSSTRDELIEPPEAPEAPGS